MDGQLLGTGSGTAAQEKSTQLGRELTRLAERARRHEDHLGRADEAAAERDRAEQVAEERWSEFGLSGRVEVTSWDEGCALPWPPPMSRVHEEAIVDMLFVDMHKRGECLRFG